MNKLLQKEALNKFFKEESKIALKKTFEVDTGSYDIKDNVDKISDIFAESMAGSSAKLFDIIDNLIDIKLATANIVPQLSAPNGPVTGKITITGK